MVGFAVLFLAVYLADRSRWWALIPSGVFGFNALVVLLATQSNGPWPAGALIVFMMALPFLVVYFLSARNWWALIPAGILASIGVVILVFREDRFNPNQTGWINGLLFLGWAATFAILWLRRVTQPTAWARYPAIGLAIAALLSLISGTGIGQFWPVFLIVAGIVLLWANRQPNKAGQLRPSK